MYTKRKHFSAINIGTVAVINLDEGLVNTEGRSSQRQILVKTHEESDKCK